MRTADIGDEDAHGVPRAGRFTAVVAPATAWILMMVAQAPLVEHWHSLLGARVARRRYTRERAALVRCMTARRTGAGKRGVCPAS